MAYKFYLYEGETYYENKKTLKFISVKNPKVVISFTSLNPDEVDNFKEILPNENSKSFRSAEEKFYRVLTDIKSVMYLTDESFANITKQVINYLNGIEDYERMCVIRDIKYLFEELKRTKQAEIQDYIKHHNKLKK